MNPEFAFKLGQLLGTLKDFLERVESEHVTSPDIDRVRTLMGDVTKKFYESGEVK